MAAKSRLIRLLVFFVLLGIGAAEALDPKNSSETYRAAVVEYVPQFTISDNLNYLWYASKGAAANGAQIIVFPECGLTIYSSRKRSHLRSIFPEYSDLKTGSVPCDTTDLITSRIEAFVALSCMAKHNKIAIVVNYGSSDLCRSTDDPQCPADGFYLYNTNFAFDDDGTLLAVQRKFHTFNEPYFNRPKIPDEVTFKTNFGVTFGMFACFDIIFESSVKLVEKYNISNVVYPTYWFDGYPLYVSLDVQERFARALDVNLLAANIHIPTIGAVGSGIYAGKFGHLDYTYNTLKKSEILYADVPLKSASLKTPPKVSPHRYPKLTGHRMFERDFTGFTFKQLDQKSASLTLTNNGLKCHVDYEYAVMSQKELAFFGAFNGSVHTNNKKHYWGVEMCLLIYCQDSKCSEVSQSSSHRFTRLKMTGDFTVKHVFTSLLLDGFMLPSNDDWIISSDKIENRHLGYKSSILSALLLGRNYEIDRPFIKE